MMAFVPMAGVYLYPIVHLVGGGLSSMVLVVADVGDIVVVVLGHLEITLGEKMHCVVKDFSVMAHTVHQNQSVQQDGGMIVLINVKTSAMVFGEIKGIVERDSSVTESLVWLNPNVHPDGGTVVNVKDFVVAVNGENNQLAVMMHFVRMEGVFQNINVQTAGGGVLNA